MWQPTKPARSQQLPGDQRLRGERPSSRCPVPGAEFEMSLVGPAMTREGRRRMLRRPSCVSPAPGCCASSRARMVGLETAAGWPRESAGIPRGTVRLHLIVLPPPLLCQYLRFPLACEDLPVEKLAPQPRGRTTDSARPRGRIRSLAFASYSGLREESNVIVCGPRARRTTAWSSSTAPTGR